MDTQPSVLDLLLPEDLNKLSQLYQHILRPLITYLVHEAKKTSLGTAEVYIKQSTLASWAGCHHDTANKACTLLERIGVTHTRKTRKTKGPTPGYKGTDCTSIGAKYQKLWASLTIFQNKQGGKD